MPYNPFQIDDSPITEYEELGNSINISTCLEPQPNDPRSQSDPPQFITKENSITYSSFVRRKVFFTAPLTDEDH